MAYLEPRAFTRHVVNPLVSRLQTGGVATLTVPGRRTGRARMVPVIPVEVESIRYLVSPYGESDSVCNLRAAGKAEGRNAVRHRRTSPTIGQREKYIRGHAACSGSRRVKDRGKRVSPHRPNCVYKG